MNKFSDIVFFKATDDAGIVVLVCASAAALVRRMASKAELVAKV